MTRSARFAPHTLISILFAISTAFVGAGAMTPAAVPSAVSAIA